MPAETQNPFVLTRAVLSRGGRATSSLLSVPLAWLLSGLVLAGLTPRTAQGATPTIQVFTDRAAWQNAMAGLSIQTETFNDFTGFTYYAGAAPAFQLPAGLTDVGRLRFEVERPSGNLIIGGDFFDPIDGTTFWRIEAATQNGSPPPVTPAVLFSQDTFGFGADWNFFSAPRSTVTIGDTTLRFADYLGTGIHFLGFTSPTAFQRVEFNVENPFNTLFHADNVSFAQVPEPSLSALCLAAIGLRAIRRAVGAHRRSI
jgi:hypothetical protein